MKPLRILIFSVVATGLSNIYAESTDGVEGVWINAAKDGYIEITRNQDSLDGTIVGGPDPAGSKRLDKNNPDPALRTRSLLGLTILNGFAYDGNHEWSGGQIYDPNNGNTYRCNLKLAAKGTLEIRGYIGIPLIGRTEIWKRKR